MLILFQVQIICLSFEHFPYSWYLSGNKVSGDGSTFNANIEGVLFNKPSFETQDDYRVTTLSFEHSSSIIGVLQCKVQYNNGMWF